MTVNQQKKDRSQRANTNNRSTKSLIRHLPLLLSGLFLIYGLLGGGVQTARASVGLDASGAAAFDRFEEAYRRHQPSQGGDQLAHFKKVFAKLRSEYVRPLSDRALIDAAISGMEQRRNDTQETSPNALIDAALKSMTATLDPHTSYLSKADYQKLRDVTRGDFAGLGVVVTKDLDTRFIRVKEVMKNSPAQRAGLKAGDLLSRLEGESTKELTLRTAAQRMRGKAGTVVRIAMIDKSGAARELVMKREVIKVSSVESRRVEDVAYIRVKKFARSVNRDVVRAMKRLDYATNAPLRGIVLDLRGNPGGLLREAIYLSNSFLESGDIVSIEGRSKTQSKRFRATKGDISKGVPMVVLIDSDSASGAEIVAAALQENGRALVMGKRSFGKGSVQIVSGTSEKGALKITTNLYYSPTKRVIQGNGVMPDVLLHSSQLSKTSRETDLPGSIQAGGIGIGEASAELDSERCPDLGQTGKDEALNCAFSYVRSGSLTAFLDRLDNRQLAAIIK